MDANLHGSVLGILVPPGADDRVLRTMANAFHELGAKIHYLGIGSRSVPVAAGVLSTDARAEDVSPGYYDALIVPGPRLAARDEPIEALLQGFSQLRRSIGAVGEGLLLLVDAGLVQGTCVAAKGDVREAVERAGGIPLEDVTVDGILVTAAGSDALEEFCERFARDISARLREYVDEVLMETFPSSDATSGAAI